MLPAVTKSQKLYEAVTNGRWSDAVKLINAAAKPNRKTRKFVAEFLAGTEWPDLLALADNPSSTGLTETELLYRAFLQGKFESAQMMVAEGAVPDAKTLVGAVRHLDLPWVRLLAGAMVKACAMEDMFGKIKPLTPAYNEAAAAPSAETDKPKLKLRQPTRPLFNLRDPE